MPLDMIHIILAHQSNAILIIPTHPTNPTLPTILQLIIFLPTIQTFSTLHFYYFLLFVIFLLFLLLLLSILVTRQRNYHGMVQKLLDIIEIYKARNKRSVVVFLKTVIWKIDGFYIQK